MGVVSEEFDPNAVAASLWGTHHHGAGLDVPAVVDDELDKLGYPEQARLALLGNLGRENAWNVNTIFKGHDDPKNNARNRGLFSWQGDRKQNLESFLAKSGGDWSPSEDNLRLQTRFMDEELRSRYPKIHKAITDPSAPLASVSRNLRDYIRYVPSAPYNTPDSEYDVKNNREWAEKAAARGLGQFNAGRVADSVWNDFDPDEVASAMWGDVTTDVATTKPVPASQLPTALTKPTLAPDTPPENPIRPDVIPEHPDTIQAQIDAAADPNVKVRSAVLTTSPEQNALFGNRDDFVMIATKTGNLWVNKDKAKKLKLRTPEQIAQFVDTNPIAIQRLTGTAEDVGDKTNTGATVLTTGPDGKELSAKIVTNPESAKTQVALDQASFGPGVKHEIVPAERVVEKRVAGAPPTGWAAELQQPAPVAQTSTPQISTTPDERTPQDVRSGQEDNAVAETLVLDSWDSPQDAARQALAKIAPKYGIDAVKVLKDNPNLSITGVNVNGKIDLTYGDLRKFGIDTNPLINQRTAEQRTENAQPDLSAPEVAKQLPTFQEFLEQATGDRDAANQLTDTRKAELVYKNYSGEYDQYIAEGLKEALLLMPDVPGASNPYLATTGKAGIGSFVSDLMQFTGGVLNYSGPGIMSRYLTGKDLGGDPLGQFGNRVEKINEASTPDTEVYKLAALPGDVAGKLPGYAIATAAAGGNPILGFALHDFVVSKGKGGSTVQNVGAGGAGAVMGGTLGFLKPLGTMAATGLLGEEIVSAVKGAADPAQTAFRTLVEKGTPVGLATGLGYGSSAVQSGDTKENIKNALLFGAMEFSGAMLHKGKGETLTPEDVAKIDGTIIRVPDENGKPQTIALSDKDGELQVTKIDAPPVNGIVLPKVLGKIKIDLKPIKEQTTGTKEVTGDIATAETKAPETPAEDKSSVAPPVSEKSKTVDAKPQPLSNTQVEFSKEQAKPFDDFRRTVIAPEDVANRDVLPEYAKDGIYDIEPHVTVKYGLHTNNHEDVIPMLKGEKPVEITLGKTSVFKGSEKKLPGTDKAVPYDVVTVEVQSPDLKRLNDKLTEGSENTTTFPYSPHITLAYVKSGLGEKYAGRTEFEGHKYTFDGVTFSPADKSGKQVIPLTQTAQRGTENSWVTRAKEDHIVSTGQLKPEDVKALEKAVKKGDLIKGKGGPYPIPKTVYAPAEFDIQGNRDIEGQKLLALSKREQAAGGFGSLSTIKPESTSASVREPAETVAMRPGDRVKNEFGYKGTVFEDKQGNLKVERVTGQIHPLSDNWKLAGKRPLESNGFKAGDVVQKKNQIGKVYERGGQLRVKWNIDGKVKSEPLSEKWAKAANPEAGSVDPSLLTLGLNKTIQDDVAPALKGAVKGLIDARDDIKKLIFAGSRGDAAKLSAMSLRAETGKMARSALVAETALKGARKYFAKNPVEDNYDLISHIEEGNLSALPPAEQMAAKQLRNLLDESRNRVQALGTGKLENYIENYFPHIWEDPKKAGAFFSGLVKRPFEGSKSFLKKRIYNTFQEGLDAGLIPVSDNPVDLTLLKIRDMDKYVAAHNTIKYLKDKGLAQYVPIGADVPEGFIKIDDKVSTVFGNPNVQFKEGFDAKLMEGLQDFAKSMSIPHERLVQIGGKRFGYAVGGSHIVSQFATPESVIAHEFGHILDARYGLQAKFVNNPLFKKELRALADQRFANEYEGTPESFQRYVRKGSEKMAVMFESLIHAPEIFKKVAPNTYKALREFINEHDELKPLLKIKPSLVLSGNVAEKRVQGLVTAGHIYAAEPAANIINNYLSPGLTGSQYGAIRNGYNAWRWMGNVLNQAQLGLSGFHAMFTTLDAVTSKLALGINQVAGGHPIEGLKSMVGTPVSPVTNFLRGNKLMKEGLVPGSTDENTRILADLVAEAGGRFRMDDFYHTKAAQKMTDAFKRGNILGGVVRTPFAALDVASRPLMEYLVPRQKLGVFADMAKDTLKRLGPDATLEDRREALQKDWDSVDNRMGQLVYDNLFWNKTIKDLSMASVRSVGWNLGDIRELGGAAKDVVYLPARIKRAYREGKQVEPIVTRRMAYAAALPVVAGTLGAVTQYLFTGKGPDELKDYFFPKTGNVDENGNPERLSLPTYMKDVYAYSRHPGKTLSHKVHPLIGMISDMLQNKDYYGTEIRHADDPLIDQLTDVAKYVGKSATPFSVQGMLKEKDRQGDTKSKILPFFGFTPAPKDIDNTKAEDVLSQIMADRRDIGTRTKLQAERSKEMSDLVRAVKRGEDITDQFQKAVAAGILTPKDKGNITLRSTRNYLQAGVMRLTVADALKVYEVATPEEREQLKQIMQNKLARAQTLTDSDKNNAEQLGLTPAASKPASRKPSLNMRMPKMH